jgi:hypothetical protein
VILILDDGYVANEGLCELLLLLVMWMGSGLKKKMTKLLKIQSKTKSCAGGSISG